MTQNGTVTDCVTYRPGDGAAGLTAMPLAQFKDYVHDKKITLEK